MEYFHISAVNVTGRSGRLVAPRVRSDYRKQFLFYSNMAISLPTLGVQQGTWLKAYKAL